MKLSEFTLVLWKMRLMSLSLLLSFFVSRNFSLLCTLRAHQFKARKPKFRAWVGLDFLVPVPASPLMASNPNVHLGCQGLKDRDMYSLREAQRKFTGNLSNQIFLAVPFLISCL